MTTEITIGQKQLPITKENVVKLMQKPEALHEQILNKISSMQKGIEKYKQEIIDYKLQQVKPRKYYLDVLEKAKNELKEIGDKIDNQEKAKQLRDLIDICSEIALFESDYETYLNQHKCVNKEDKYILSKIKSEFNQQAFDKKYIECIKCLVPMCNVIDCINNQFQTIIHNLIIVYYQKESFIITNKEAIYDTITVGNKTEYKLIKKYIGDYSLYALIKGAMLYLKEKDKFFDFIVFESILKKQQKEAENIIKELEFFCE